jgi:hypothetical protein
VRGDHKLQPLRNWNAIPYPIQMEAARIKACRRLGSRFNVTGKAKNVSEATSTMFVHFKFISKSGEVLGNVECNTGDLEPGQTETMNCLSNGKYTEKYDKLTAEATF